jgi:hypothetical protein
MLTKINVVIPMAGLGSRFSNAGFKNIKPLIPLNGKTFIEWSIESVDFKTIETHFSLEYGSFFIVNNLCIKDIFETFKMPPIDKDGSCNYERLFGLYFIIKNINTLDVSNYFIKYNGGRL